MDTVSLIYGRGTESQSQLNKPVQKTGIVIYKPMSNSRKFNKKVSNYVRLIQDLTSIKP